MNERRQHSDEGQIRKGRRVPFIERRAAIRFALQLPVLVRWKDGSELRKARTMCEDVSTKGIYFVLAEDIRDGTTVEVEVALPSHITLEKRVRVRCSGHVLRSKWDGAKACVAVVFKVIGC